MKLPSWPAACRCGLVIEATPANALAADSLALCDQITCLLVSLVGEPFGQLDRSLMPSDLRAGG